MNNKNTILITGGGGLVGSNLAYKLQDKYKVVCLDRHGHRAQFKNSFNNNVKFIKGDITNEKLLDKIIKNCNFIIHLAGGGGNPACVKDPVWATQTHIIGTDLLLKKASKYKIKKFIFASSQSVYTTFHKRKFPFLENIELKPDDFYGMLKKTAEDLIRSSGINYSILRFSNIYGYSDLCPLQDGGAVNNFVKFTFIKKGLQIYGTGKQGIDYVNLRDATKAIELALKDRRNKTIYNVGSGKLVSIEEIAKTVKRIFKEKLDKEVEIKKTPVTMGKIWPDRLMSIKKIKKDLKWKPEISLKEGLEEMIINYKK